MTMNEYQILQAQCRRWGGDLLAASEDSIKSFITDAEPGIEDIIAIGPTFFVAPFTLKYNLGILWNRHEILYAPPLNWTAIIHEMGHVFASKEDPNNADEWSFFGWEMALVRFLSLNLDQWIQDNKDYVVEIHEPPFRYPWPSDGGPIIATGTPSPQFQDFGKLTASQHSKIMTEAIEESTRAGLIDSSGRPIAIRKGGRFWYAQQSNV